MARKLHRPHERWKRKVTQLPLFRTLAHNSADSVAGYHRIAGLTTDLHLKGTQFNTALAGMLISQSLMPSFLIRFRYNSVLCSVCHAIHGPSTGF